MTLYEELYFNITISGEKRDLRKFVSFLESGELDDFFEVTRDYIHLDDEFETSHPETMLSVVFSNDEIGIEIDEFDVDEFLEVFCRAGKDLHIQGDLFDVDDDYSFVSNEGDSYYVNGRRSIMFNDELDREAYDEDMYED